MVIAIPSDIETVSFAGLKFEFIDICPVPVAISIATVWRMPFHHYLAGGLLAEHDVGEIGITIVAPAAPHTGLAKCPAIVRRLRQQFLRRGN